jgi:hypothetical protein
MQPVLPRDSENTCPPANVAAGFLEHVPEQTLRAQFDRAAAPMQKTFAGLMLGYLFGDAIDMAPVMDQFGIHLTSVDDYARRVLGVQA